jgi:tetratricopeptide (TPR) repeat protein
MAAAFATFTVLLIEKFSSKMSGKIFWSIAALILIPLSVATFERNGVWKDNITLWQDVIAKSPNKSRPYINLGTALGKAGRMQEAIKALTRAIQLNPDNSEPYVNLGAALASVSRLNEAARTLAQAVALDPENADALNNLGIVLKDIGRLDEAITVLSKAIQIQPDNAMAYFNLGRTFAKAGQNERAINALQQAIQINPEYDNAAIELAGVLNQSGRFREAYEILNPRMSRIAARPDARFNLGLAAHCLGEKLTSQRELSALFRLNTVYAQKLQAVMQKACSKDEQPGNN